MARGAAKGLWRRPKRVLLALLAAFTFGFVGIGITISVWASFPSPTLRIFGIWICGS